MRGPVKGSIIDDHAWIIESDPIVCPGSSGMLLQLLDPNTRPHRWGLWTTCGHFWLSVFLD